MTRILVCDCLHSQNLDPERLQAALGQPVSRPYTELCLRQGDAAATAMAEGDVLIACGQEARRFAAIAEGLGVAPPLCVDIRDRAGWTDDADATPKQAALLAEALLPQPETPTRDVVSAGTCLVIGDAEVALPAARELAGEMAVTVLLPRPELDEPPVEGDLRIIAGRLTRAIGTLGRFHLQLDALQLLQPGGRGAAGFTAPRDGAQSDCDVILDLSGGTPLFPAPGKRDGYLRADPGSPVAVAEAVAKAARHVGTFEKPLHIRLEQGLCAHSRAGQPACNRCLDICPTGALTPAGETVAVDPLVCAGCGGCASVCPSGAISFEDPPRDHLLRRIRVLADTYTRAGGTAPRLLVHDAHGAEMIRLAARFGRGLPANVIPLLVEALPSFGHAEMLAALVSGFGQVTILPGPRTEREVLDGQIELARLMGAEGRLDLIEPAEPDALSDALYGHLAPEPVAVALPMGSRRQVARLAAKALGVTEPVALPKGAPYGAVLVDNEACTLCLSCVSLCPSGALMDNPDKPQLRFQEDACLQCGLCANLCPEDAIRLEPRFDPSDAALSSVILHEEEPFACIECGKPFGVASTVRRVVEKLEGRHPMFAGSAQTRLIEMCEDCRIQAQFNRDDPMAFGGPRQPRTTEDYQKKPNGKH
ncbi:4Fe-4S binding protein [Paracoccus zhejiangensis]|uniref:(4Fe-4S)-binding protein n=1 Tax=Paracoccus zhejiangensis TaxID=1077935 RepID=A0A2H5F239_9RHOB|nr:4Fe-4S binding protein [Paracoccus zhejiangensis]AUH65629.1 (4Fe-4S)-binding protein [Paracoccus zhejiangensis]